MKQELCDSQMPLFKIRIDKTVNEFIYSFRSVERRMHSIFAGGFVL